MRAHLPKSAWKDDDLFLHNICDLYAQLDVNEDGLVSWDEMFERHGTATSDFSHTENKGILPYYPAKVTDSRGTGADRSDMKDAHIEHMACIATVDKVLPPQSCSNIVLDQASVPKRISLLL
jgi:hypothetical protein